MTRRALRRCPRCAAALLKVEGCNQLTCRCGAKLCYVCRAADVRPAHFCQHARRAGQRVCRQCHGCPLWQLDEALSEEEATARGVARIRDDAIRRRGAQHGWIGPPAELGTTPVEERRLLRRGLVAGSAAVAKKRRRTQSPSVDAPTPSQRGIVLVERSASVCSADGEACPAAVPTDDARAETAPDEMADAAEESNHDASAVRLTSVDQSDFDQRCQIL